MLEAHVPPSDAAILTYQGETEAQKQQQEQKQTG